MDRTDTARALNGRRLRDRWALLLVGPVLLGVALPSTPVLGQVQDPYAPGVSSAGVVLDSAWLQPEWHPTWRGFLLGATGLRLGTDIALAGRNTTDTGKWGLAGHLGGALTFDERPSTLSEGHVHGGLALIRYFRADRTSIAVIADVYHLPGAETSKSGIELGLVGSGLEWNWGLEEENPTFEAGFYRDVGRFDAFRAELGFNLGWGIQNLAPPGFDDFSWWVESRVSWTGYEVDPIGGDEWGGHVGLGVALERGAVSVNPRLGVLDTFNSGLHGYASLGIRVWPDATN